MILSAINQQPLEIEEWSRIKIVAVGKILVLKVVAGVAEEQFSAARHFVSQEDVVCSEVRDVHAFGRHIKMFGDRREGVAVLLTVRFRIAEKKRHVVVAFLPSGAIRLRPKEDRKSHAVSLCELFKCHGSIVLYISRLCHPLAICAILPPWRLFLTSRRWGKILTSLTRRARSRSRGG